MANEVSIYEPRHLIEVVRTTPPIRTFLRDRFFSNVKTFPTRRVDIDIVKGNRKMAAFIHPLVGGEIVQSEGYETKWCRFCPMASTRHRKLMILCLSCIQEKARRMLLWWAPSGMKRTNRLKEKKKSTERIMPTHEERHIGSLMQMQKN